MHDATTFDFSPFRTVVMARPSKGAWIGNTIERAVVAGCTVVYVGKRARRVHDLFPFDHNPEREVREHERLGIVAEKGEVCVVATVRALSTASIHGWSCRGR